MRAWKFIAVTATAALLLLPGSALAKKKHRKPVKLGPVVTATALGNIASAAGQVSTATAICPAGKQAVGGGFTAPISGPQLFVIDSFRSSPTAWTVVARREIGSAAATAYAYCRKASPAISDVTATGTVPSGGGMVGTASATCPSGSHLVSGGFEIERGPANGQYALPTMNLAVNTSPSWMVQAVNNSNGDHAFTVHAYCMRKVAAPKFVDANTTLSVATDATGTLSSPACPAPKKPRKGKQKQPAKLLSAGGFASQSTVPIEIFGESRINGATWLNSGINVTGPDGSIHLTSQGICV
jgi:hypothetical protein